MAISLLASAVPIPTGPVGAYPVPSVGTPAKNAPQSEGYVVANAPIVTLPLNQLATRADIGSVFASGFGVIYGLTPTNSSLVVTIAAGQGNIYGIAGWAGGTITIPDATARVFIWLKSDYSSSPGTNSLAYTTTTTPPSTTGSAGQCILLCSCVTSGGTVVGGTFDYTGVVYLSKGGVPIRYTNDPVEPTDTPGANTIFWTQCPGGLFLWDGTRYYRYPQSGVYSGTGNATLTLAQTMRRVLTSDNLGNYTYTLPTPLTVREWIVRAPAAHSIAIYDGAVTVTVASGKTALVNCDGTSVFRVTSDV